MDKKQTKYVSSLLRETARRKKVDEIEYNFQQS